MTSHFFLVYNHLFLTIPTRCVPTLPSSVILPSKYNINITKPRYRMETLGRMESVRIESLRMESVRMESVRVGTDRGNGGVLRGETLELLLSLSALVYPDSYTAFQHDFWSVIPSSKYNINITKLRDTMETSGRDGKCESEYGEGKRWRHCHFNISNHASSTSPNLTTQWKLWEGLKMCIIESVVRRGETLESCFDGPALVINACPSAYLLRILEIEDPKKEGGCQSLYIGFFRGNRKNHQANLNSSIGGTRTRMFNEGVVEAKCKEDGVGYAC
ncbi:hypothetical protein K435DRAFT_793223 [Dendrothele bispora CBS 962.96]|uniref:Uncharacterized protein n=1 Tax=Dendrothele bispora (strain CBS 962.96) TaxID=1314807 RepID=A0A4S8MG27_DENBC|nr:hypothetical protein K435DRAFT_793223 [Dendrothele bispora CBS 962.96]